MKPTFIDVLKKASLAFSICIFSNQIIAQNVGVNATGVKADVSAMLDVSAQDKGLLIPRVPFLTSVNDAVTIPNPARSLLIFTKIEGMNPQPEGYYYNDGDNVIPVWVRLSTTNPNPISGWLLDGNTGTNPGVNFIGTTDDQEIALRQNNEKIGVIYKGGALGFTGNIETGVTPFALNGQGTKMMYIPHRAAFRVGRLDDLAPDVWNDINIGNASFAANYNTKAKGDGSAAFGEQTEAVGSAAVSFGSITKANADYSIAAGYASQATGSQSIATGFETIASGENSFTAGYKTAASKLNATALGDQTIASGINSHTAGSKTAASNLNATAFGDQTVASGSNSFASGFTTKANAKNSVALGNQSVASGENSFSLGEFSKAEAKNSVAFGYNCKAQGDQAFAMGSLSEATSTGAIVMGTQCIASGIRSFALGFNTIASGITSISSGNYTVANGTSSVAFGSNTVANVNAQLAIGRYNVISNVTPNDQNISFRAFQVGNGTDENNRSDAAFIRYNGNMTIAGTLTENSDIRLKKNIIPLVKVLEKISTISPITYNFKDTYGHPSGDQIGFSAQEVQKEFPELVSQDESGYLSVSYSKMTAVAIQAIKEQQQQIDELKKENKDQKEINNQLLQRLEKLEAAAKK